MTFSGCTYNCVVYFRFHCDHREIKKRPMHNHRPETFVSGSYCDSAFSGTSTCTCVVHYYKPGKARAKQDSSVSLNI